MLKIRFEDAWNISDGPRTLGMRRFRLPFYLKDDRWHAGEPEELFTGPPIECRASFGYVEFHVPAAYQNAMREYFDRHAEKIIRHSQRRLAMFRGRETPFAAK